MSKGKFRSKEAAIEAAKRLTKNYGNMVVWKFKDNIAYEHGTWTFAPEGVAPKKAIGRMLINKYGTKTKGDKK